MTFLMHWQITFFKNNFTSAFSTGAFTPVNTNAECLILNFSFESVKVYNGPIGMEELQDALHIARDTLVGPGEMHYQLLKHLPKSSLLILLNICFINVWLSGDFPSDWKKVINFPVPKPRKDPTYPTNYHHVALTSCIYKTMERMINCSLVWYLESHNLLTNVPCRFRSIHSMIDHIVRFEMFCWVAFIHKQHLVSVLIYLVKAYATTL